MRNVLRWIGNLIWIPILGLMITVCVIGVIKADLDEILRNAVILCLSCIGIG